MKNFREPDGGESKTEDGRPSRVVSIFSENATESSKDTAESSLEAFRQSGLAYSAAIALAASVVFMLIVGWGADLLFESSPWGIVIGIVLGAIIGFIQFFRINAQIFRK
ncbi:MAG: hypothetical protein C4325_12165 [Blastocatellia bacterium]